jgi:hypothetical protein
VLRFQFVILRVLGSSAAQQLLRPLYSVDACVCDVWIDVGSSRTVQVTFGVGSYNSRSNIR